MTNPVVLVLGYRRGLFEALEKRKLDYVLFEKKGWKLGHWRGLLGYHLLPLKDDLEPVLSTILKNIAPNREIGAIIASKEWAVLPAAHARKRLGVTGVGPEVALHCHDKLHMKRHLAPLGIPMTEFLEIDPHTDAADLMQRLGLPVVIKERRSSGGRGIHFVQSKTLLASLLAEGRYAERYVDAKEMSVESFISEGKIRFCNLTQYYVKRHVNIVPAVIDQATADSVLALNRKALDHLEIDRGLAHLELYLTAEGPIFGEIALRPPGGYIMDLLEHSYGFDAWDAFLTVELGEALQASSQPQAWSAVTVLHPGAGTVAGIDGVEEVRVHPFTKDFKLKVDQASVIEKRIGVGNDIGRIIQVAPGPADILRSIEYVKSTLKVDLLS